jgi:hypothetical protein
MPGYELMTSPEMPFRSLTEFSVDIKNVLWQFPPHWRNQSGEVILDSPVCILGHANRGNP